MEDTKNTETTKTRYDVLGDTRIVAVDFDGTLCENHWPEIGEPKWDMINWVIGYKDIGYKVILWTSREGKELEEAVAWCEDKGLIFDAVNDNLPEMVELFGFNSRKVFADIYFDDKSQIPAQMHTMSPLEKWADEEIKIACKKDLSADPDNIWDDYMTICCRSAFKAYSSLCSDEHSGASIRVTKDILDRLIDVKPLTPIEDTLDGWKELTYRWTNGTREFQCKRMSSLFKKITHDGIVSYTDHDRVVCVDVRDESVSYGFGLVTKLIDKWYPIKMPYMPADKPIKVYCEDFLTYRENGDFDTIGIFSIKMPDDDEPTPMWRYFKSDIHDTEWVEIEGTEYYKRKDIANELAKKIAAERKENEKNDTDRER